MTVSLRLLPRPGLVQRLAGGALMEFMQGISSYKLNQFRLDFSDFAAGERGAGRIASA